MPTKNEIRQAFRDGIAANTAQAPLLRDLRHRFREPDDEIADTTEALRYVHQTAAAAIDVDRWNRSWNLIAAALTSMLWDGNRQVRDTRNKVRSLMVDPTSPEWLRLDCQKLKRTLRLDQNQALERVYDQQQTDPIVAQADAALAVIRAANSTYEQLVEAATTIERYKELTPE